MELSPAGFLVETLIWIFVFDWLCASGGQRRVKIDSVWRENPRQLHTAYPQMKLPKRVLGQGYLEIESQNTDAVEHVDTFYFLTGDRNRLADLLPLQKILLTRPLIVTEFIRRIASF